MDREKAIERIKTIQSIYEFKSTTTKEAIDVAIEALSVERTGEWIDFDLKPAPNGVPVEKCGNCGEWSTQMGKNFCPNCGADMRGEK